MTCPHSRHVARDREGGRARFAGTGPTHEIEKPLSRVRPMTLAAARSTLIATLGPDVGWNCSFDVSGPLPSIVIRWSYDWLYINAIYPHREWLVRLNRYAGFTDIEFNPERSVNCQARSCALFVSLMTKGLLDPPRSISRHWTTDIIGVPYGKKSLPSLRL
jgi:hypothetical protein